MKTKLIVVSLFVFLMSSVNAEAQVAVRRPFLARFFGSPAVHDLTNYALQRFLPGLPPLNFTPTQLTVKITVAPVVKTNLSATKKNLAEAETKLKDLYKKNGLTKTGSPTTSSGDDEIEEMN